MSCRALVCHPPLFFFGISLWSWTGERASSYQLTYQSSGDGFLVSFRVLRRVVSCTSKLKKPLTYKQAPDTARATAGTKATSCTGASTCWNLPWETSSDKSRQGRQPKTTSWHPEKIPDDGDWDFISLSGPTILRSPMSSCLAGQELCRCQSGNVHIQGTEQRSLVRSDMRQIQKLFCFKGLTQEKHFSICFLTGIRSLDTCCAFS